MVRAVETSLQELFEGSKQYQVPLYQRPYSWRGPQLARLWEDVVKLAEDRRNGSPTLTHFIGSLVLAPGFNVGPAGVQEYLVVDGQQRLTTLSLLLCAIRDHRAEHEDAFHHDRVNEQHLISKWKQERHRLKMLATQADRGAYAAVVDVTPDAGDTSGVGAAYRSSGLSWPAMTTRTTGTSRPWSRRSSSGWHWCRSRPSPVTTSTGSSSR